MKPRQPTLIYLGGSSSDPGGECTGVSPMRLLFVCPSYDFPCKIQCFRRISHLEKGIFGEIKAQAAYINLLGGGFLGSWGGVLEGGSSH